MSSMIDDGLCGQKEEQPFEFSGQNLRPHTFILLFYSCVCPPFAPYQNFHPLNQKELLERSQCFVKLGAQIKTSQREANADWWEGDLASV